MIKVGDRVRHADGDLGEVICFRGGKVFVWWDQDEYMAEYRDAASLLKHATPIDAPAPELLTGAQVAQVLEAFASLYSSGEPPSERRLRQFAQSERERQHG